MRKALLFIVFTLLPLSLWAAGYLGQKEGVSSNHVHCVLQDDRGFLWIGTDAGLDLYDGDRIQTFPRPVLSLAEIGGLIWAGTQEGLYFYNPADGQFSRFRVTTRYGVNIIAPVTAMAADGNRLLVGTNGQGLFLYDKTSGELIQQSVHTPYVGRIGILPSGHLLVGRPDGSTALLGAAGEYLKESPTVLPHKNDAFTDRDGTLWIPTPDKGLMFIPREETGTLTCPYPDKGLGETDASISEDSDGNLWIGISDRIYTLPAGGKKITAAKGIRIKGVISSILCSGQHVWIGTEKSGLYRYSPAGRTLKHFPVAASVHTLHRLQNGNILVGTDRGVFSFLPASNSFEPEMNRAKIRIILNGEASEGRRLSEFEVVSRSSITAFAWDNSRHLYMATSDRGVFRKDLVASRWEHLVSTRSGSIPGNKITTLCTGKDGGIWAGTAGEGLWFLPKDSLSFSRIILPDRRLDGVRITSLAADGEGRLWISTSQGIWSYNPAANSISPYNADPGELLYASSGKLFVSQKEFLVCIEPTAATGPVLPPPVVIREMTFGDSTLFIPPGGRKIRLRSDQNSFSIRLAALRYTDPSTKLYSWRLKGFEKNWTKGGSENIATYTKIPPGSYNFEAANCSDFLSVTVLPPWWKSTAASIVWLLLILCAMALGYFFVQRAVKRRYAAILKEQEQAREKEIYEQRIRFFIGLVHEIRTPLTLIRLHYEKEPHREDDTISRNLDYIQETIDRILTYDKNSVDGVRILSTRMDLGVLASGVTYNFEESARAKGLRIECSVPERPVFVFADEDCLTKILNNLLSNALKYAGSVIRITVSSDDGRAFLSVEDNGPGVVPEEREKIFGMFYTPAEDKVAQASGMGVGLAYARQMATAMGGGIGADTSELGGAKFTLALPLLDEAAKEKPEGTFMEMSAAEHPSGVSVLVVEDNAELLETVCGELSTWYYVHPSANGAEALDLIAAETVDVVVSDVMMPVMDGLELCRTLKEDLSYSHIPVILLTAKVSLPDKAEGMESGADAYVEKPFSIRQLHSQIDNLLRLRESSRQALSLAEDLPKQHLSGPDRKFIDSINASIEKQLAEESFSIEALAYDMAMSRTNFFRKFKALTGSTPNDYLKNYRLKRAAELIRSGDRINEAAEKVGFTSSSYFAKCFKQRFGVLPKDYARKH